MFQTIFKIFKRLVQLHLNRCGACFSLSLLEHFLLCCLGFCNLRGIEEGVEEISHIFVRHLDWGFVRTHVWSGNKIESHLVQNMLIMFTWRLSGYWLHRLHIRLYFLLTSSMSRVQFHPIKSLPSDSLTNRDLELLSLAVCQPGQSRPGKTSQDNSVRWYTATPLSLPRELWQENVDRSAQIWPELIWTSTKHLNVNWTPWSEPFFNSINVTLPCRRTAALTCTIAQTFCFLISLILNLQIISILWKEKCIINDALKKCSRIYSVCKSLEAKFEPSDAS